MANVKQRGNGNMSMIDFLVKNHYIGTYSIPPQNRDKGIEGKKRELIFELIELSRRRLELTKQIDEIEKLIAEIDKLQGT